jgi:hypothetical protein
MSTMMMIVGRSTHNDGQEASSLFDRKEEEALFKIERIRLHLRM